MLNKKVLMVAVVVMMVLAMVPMAAAADNYKGSGFTTVPIVNSGNGTQANPYTVLYVGWSWSYPGWGSGTAMGNGSGHTSPWTSVTSYTNATGYTYTNITDIHTSGKINVTNGTGQDVWYIYMYIDLDTMNYTNTTGVPAYVTDIVKEKGSNFDYIIVDMFFSPIMNTQNQANANFVSAFSSVNATHTKMASIFSENYTTGVSSAPSNFGYRDTLSQSSPSTFARTFNKALADSGATVSAAEFKDYLELLSGLN
ncbi:hypothetical protein [Methanolapillus millepedarum]|uniref:Uncharacterized protein n=1 Tax=Methanolapillus millepedarum TaxID=3028296 RepID=A0AA96V6J4_9EURY|nr:hypothetical protein MsAc7_16150 [Methanosarcinaceae archaeon Ac7]